MLSGVMRPGEAASLRRRHLSLPEDHGVAGLVIIVIVDPKTAHLGGAAIQHATLEEPAAIPLLRWFLADVPPDAFLWAGPSYEARLASFEYAFKRALARLRLEELGFTPASVRAGAATEIWIRTFNAGLIQRKGRWASERSLRHYLQQAAATLALQRLGTPLRSQLQQLAAQLPALLQPPAQSPPPLIRRLTHRALAPP